MPVARYPRYRFPPAIISHAVWLYYRFTLSFRDVEDLLAQRGITVSYESIRHWCEIFGAAYARRLRRWAGPVGNTWHLDELFVPIRGQPQYLWRAVDQDGEVIDILLQPRWDRHAAARFFRKLLKRSGRVPDRLVTDRFGSYRAAHRVIMPSVVHDTTRYANNRAEVSHQPTRWRERQCGASNRWHRPSGSSRSTTSFATYSPLDDIAFAPAISDFYARARSLRGTPWQRPDDFGVETIPNVAVVDVNLTMPSHRHTSSSRGAMMVSRTELTFLEAFGTVPLCGPSGDEGARR